MLILGFADDARVYSTPTMTRILLQGLGSDHDPGTGDRASTFYRLTFRRRDRTEALFSVAVFAEYGLAYRDNMCLSRPFWSHSKLETLLGSRFPFSLIIISIETLSWLCPHYCDWYLVSSSFVVPLETPQMIQGTYKPSPRTVTATAFS